MADGFLHCVSPSDSGSGCEAEARAITLDHALVMQSCFGQPRDTGLIQLAHDLTRGSHHKRPIRDGLAFGNKGPCPDQAVLPDGRAVLNRGPHANQAAVADRTPMQHRFVSHRTIRAKRQRIAGIGVDNRVFLNIGPVALSYRFVVAPDRHPAPDRDAQADMYIADDIGIGCNPCLIRIGKLGRNTVQRVKRHVRSSNSSFNSRTFSIRPGWRDLLLRSAVTMARTRASLSSISSLIST